MPREPGRYDSVCGSIFGILSPLPRVRRRTRRRSRGDRSCPRGTPCRSRCRAGSSPPSRRRAACRRSGEVARAGRLDRQGAPQAVRDGVAVARAGVHVVRALVLGGRSARSTVLRDAALRDVGRRRSCRPRRRTTARRTRGRRCGCRSRPGWTGCRRDLTQSPSLARIDERLDRVVAVLADRDLLDASSARTAGDDPSGCTSGRADRGRRNRST